MSDPVNLADLLQVPRTIWDGGPPIESDRWPEGADETPIRNWGDFHRLLTTQHQSLFWKALDPFQYGYFAPASLPYVRSSLSLHFKQRAAAARAKREIEQALSAGTWSGSLGMILHFLRSSMLFSGWGGFRDGPFRRIMGSNKAAEAAILAIDPTSPPEPVVELEELNLALASRWAQDFIADGPDKAARQDAIARMAHTAGARTDIAIEHKAAVAAAYLAKASTGQGVALDDLFEAAEQQENPANLDVSSLRWKSAPPPDENEIAAHLAEAAPGAGNFFKKLLDIPRKVVAEAGRAIRNVSKEILRVDQNVPWLSQFVLRPTGVMLHAKFFEQLGVAMVSGRISDFDERALGMEAANTATATGQVCLAVGPLLPPPYNVVFIAAGVVLVAGGQALRGAIQQAERERELDKELERQAKAKAEAETEFERLNSEASRLEEEAQEAERAAKEAGQQFETLSTDEPAPRGRLIAIVGGAATAAAAAITAALALVYWR